MEREEERISDQALVDQMRQTNIVRGFYVAEAMAGERFNLASGEELIALKERAAMARIFALRAHEDAKGRSLWTHLRGDIVGLKAIWQGEYIWRGSCN